LLVASLLSTASQKMMDGDDALLGQVHLCLLVYG
jgi:hypothetical protein